MRKMKRFVAVFLGVFIICGLSGCDSGSEWFGAPRGGAAPTLDLAYVNDFELVGLTADGAFYRPIVPDGFHAFGHYGQGGHGQPCGFMFVARELERGTLAEPIDYEHIGASPNCSIWRPIPPPGYVCLGFVAQAGFEKPSVDEIRCVREDLAVSGELGKCFSVTSGGPDLLLSFQVIPVDETGIYIGTFASVPSYPTADSFFSIDTKSVKRHDLSRKDIEELIEEYGPVLWLHPSEKYFLDEPEFVLDHGVSLAWGIVYNETDYDSFRVEEQDSMPTSSHALLDDARHVEDDIKPSSSAPTLFRYWLRIDDSLKPGDLASAKALVRVLPVNCLFTELQFWFFYPFNGPGRVEACSSSICCTDNYLGQGGRHYGDWEHVSLLIVNSTRELITVYMSRHKSGEWFRRCGGAWSSRLQFEGSHPVIYAAYYSHAHYPNAGTHYYERVWSKDWWLGTASADLFDLTEAGIAFGTFHPDNYRIISSDSSEYRVTEPDWIEFTGRWGQYERLRDKVYWDFCGLNIDIPVYTYEEVGSGPSGPGQKSSWKNGDCAEVWWSGL